MHGKNHANLNGTKHARQKPCQPVGEVGVVGVVGVADGARLGGHRQNEADATPPGGGRPD